MAADVVPQEIIEQKIFLIRGHKAMLSNHLAGLYGVEAKRLIQAVKRNKSRFPEDFMCRLTWEEMRFLRSQFVTLDNHDPETKGNRDLEKRGRYPKYLSYAFTEQGVAMLSSVLRSKRAIQVNIAIMRAFVKLRQMLSAHKELAQKLNELERKIEKHDGEISVIFQAIRQLMAPAPARPRRKIGF